MKILIIDDDAPVRYMLREICLYSGWEPIESTDGEAGLEAFVRNSPDVVLVDYHMPKMDGLRTVQEIRTRNSQVPILVLTVDERQEVADRFLDAGATDFALKPVKAPDLISRILLHKRLIDLTRTSFSAEWEGENPMFVTKGISKVTLQHVAGFLKEQKQPCTVDEICSSLGLAYPTVYRYITYLMKKGNVRTILSYQKVGRPKNRYEWLQDSK